MAKKSKGIIERVEEMVMGEPTKKRAKKKTKKSASKKANKKAKKTKKR